jgi:hypothetical protein
MLTDLARLTLGFLCFGAFGLLVFPAPVPLALRRSAIGLAVIQVLAILDATRDEPFIGIDARTQIGESIANDVVPPLAAGLVAWIAIVVARAWLSAARELRAAPPRRR